MKKLDLLIIKSFIGPFLSTFFIALFILLMQFLWKYVDDMVGKGLPWTTLTQLLFYASATFIPLALPLAILLSSIMTYGNLGEHYELVAIKSAGISLIKAMKPVIIIAIFISIFTFFFSNYILPVANLKFGSLLYDIRQQKPAINIKPGIFYKEIDNYIIKISEKSKDGKTIKDIIIYDHTKNQPNVIIAEKGFVETTPDKLFLVFKLYNGYNYIEIPPEHNKRKNNFPFQRTKFKEQIFKIDISDFILTRTSEELFKQNYQMLNIAQLDNAIDSIEKNKKTITADFANNFYRTYFFYSSYYKNNNKTNFKYSSIMEPQNYFKNQNYSQYFNNSLNIARNILEGLNYRIEDIKQTNIIIAKHKIEWHRKFTLSIACLIFMFIGASLGSIIRKGGFGFPVVVSVLFFIIYHVISITGEKFVKSGVASAHTGMWAATLIIFPLAIYLTYKSINDSTILDQSKYYITIKRLITFANNILRFQNPFKQNHL